MQCPRRSKKAGGGHMGADKEAFGGADWREGSYQQWGNIFCVNLLPKNIHSISFTYF